MDKRIETWLDRDPDPTTRSELQRLLAAHNHAEIQRRFAGRLTFGTAGLRGLMGAGPARINRLVVRETTAGLAQYLLQQVPQAAQRGVVVGYDAREGSRIFAQDAACILGAQGLHVHLFERDVPTPLTCFAVGHLQAAAGIMITASHNPAAYNGMKVYWEQGTPIIPPHDAKVLQAIQQASLDTLPWADLEDLYRSHLITLLGETLERAYIEELGKLSIHPFHACRSKLRIAYTPLHGVGARWVERALRQAGFSEIQMVAAQKMPNGAFPTLTSPNPEDPESLTAVLELARQVDASLACANDPDADRLAIAVRMQPGTYRILTGDEIGILLADDRLQKAPPHAVVATTLVSCRLLKHLAAQYGVHYFETLTGFKWIANEARARQIQGQRPIFAYEEALGYSIGTLLWDKDGISSLVAFAELTAACHAAGLSVWDRLEAIYRTHGYFATAQRNITLDPHGTARLLTSLRRHTPASIGGRALEAKVDFLWDPHAHVPQSKPSHLPPADLLAYHLQGDARILVRPSGTEPKLKCYYELRTGLNPHQSLIHVQHKAQQELDQLIEAHQQELAIL